MSDLNFASSPINQSLTAERKIELYTQMVRIRRFEQVSLANYQKPGRMGGFLHLYIGQESVAVGTLSLCGENDHNITAYRCHAHALASGMNMNECMAELYGKQTGCSKGKGGSMHLFDKRTHFYGGHAIVGGQNPLGIGLAFATKYENEVLGEGRKRVTLCFLGDGALNQGALHEAMNLAAVLELPCIFVLENNRYSMGTAIDRGTSMASDLSVKASAYGMPYCQADGMDVYAVYNAMKRAVDRARVEQFPAFAEIKTYRFKGHSMSDPQKYRSKDEVSQYEDSDPIRRLADALTASGDLGERSFKALSQSVRDEVHEAIRWAEQSPEPDPATELYSDVVTDPFGEFGPTSLPKMCEHEPGTLPEDA